MTIEPGTIEPGGIEPGIIEPGSIDTERLSKEITDLVRQVEGVTAVYEARPLVEGVAARVAELADGEGVVRRLVDVDLDDDALRVGITFGSDPSHPAADVCRRVHDAVADILQPVDAGRPTLISVTVGRVG